MSPFLSSSLPLSSLLSPLSSPPLPSPPVSSPPLLLISSSYWSIFQTFVNCRSLSFFSSFSGFFSKLGLQKNAQESPLIPPYSGPLFSSDSVFLHINDEFGSCLPHGVAFKVCQFFENHSLLVYIYIHIF